MNAIKVAKFVSYGITGASAITSAIMVGKDLKAKKAAEVETEAVEAEDTETVEAVNPFDEVDH